MSLSNDCQVINQCIYRKVSSHQLTYLRIYFTGLIKVNRSNDACNSFVDSFTVIIIKVISSQQKYCQARRKTLIKFKDRFFYLFCRAFDGLKLYENSYTYLLLIEFRSKWATPND